MRMKARLLAASIAAACAFGAIPLTAAADVYVQVAPPPLRHEVLPAPRHGYVWAPGYWDWRHGRYQWIGGHWERERRGMYWHPSRWERRGGHWELVQGGWNRRPWDARRYAERDRDRDGIPDRRDFDRDNDGVPNRVDRAPNNPYVR